MNFYELVVNAALAQSNCEVSSLVLGWHASGIFLSDGRWGIGAVPDPLKEAHIVREQHTRNLIGASAHSLAQLIVSPFPQEFAAASAAVSALLPPPEGEGLPLDSIRLVTKGEKVAVLGYHRSIIPFLQDWNWELMIFDDYSMKKKCPNVYPESEMLKQLDDVSWVWITAEALRDRAFLELQGKLAGMKGVFLQGGGVAWLNSGYRDFGVSYLVLPHRASPEINPFDVIARIGVGGDAWSDSELVWKVHSVQ
ncbi:MAG: DUF364 domain-containing protein [Synergistaceae bacterium]|nr:DUF364 domain-containing protein [Synergistaceae bacterium]